MHSTFRGQRLLERGLASSDFALYVVDDDDSTGDILHLLLKTVGLQVRAYTSPLAFIEEYAPDRPGCIIMDLRMPEMNGIEALVRLREQSAKRSSWIMPVIMISGYLCPSMIGRAIRQGVVDFFEKPFDKELLLESIQHWIQYDVQTQARWQRHQAVSVRLATLSKRERQVLMAMLDGMANKEIARHLGVSPKAIETYRANLMRKMGARTAASLAAQVVGCLDACGQPLMCPSCLVPPR